MPTVLKGNLRLSSTVYSINTAVLDQVLFALSSQITLHTKYQSFFSYMNNGAKHFLKLYNPKICKRFFKSNFIEKLQNKRGLPLKLDTGNFCLNR